MGFQEDDLATLAAQQYFIEEGLLDVSRLESQLHNYLPDFELNGKEMAKERWIQAIMYQYRKVSQFRARGVSPLISLISEVWCQSSITSPC